MLADALDDGAIAVHPLSGLRWTPEGDHEAQLARARPRADPRRARPAARARAPRPQLLVEFLASTGLRVSEALGLDWPDLDLGDRPQVKVRAQRYRTAERVALKSAYARREIPLTAAMAEALRALRPDDPRAAEGPVFVDGRGRPLKYTTLYHRSGSRRARRPRWTGLACTR